MKKRVRSKKSVISFAITSGHPNGIGPEIILKSLVAIFHKSSFAIHASGYDLSVIQSLKEQIFSKKTEFIILGSFPAFKWQAKQSGLTFSVIAEETNDLTDFFPKAKVYRMVSIGYLNDGGNYASIHSSCSIFFVDIELIPDFSKKSKVAFYQGSSSKTKLGKSFNPLLLPDSSVGDHTYQVLEASAMLVKAGRVGGVINGPVCKESIAQYSPLKGFRGQSEFYARVFSTKNFSMTFLSPLFNLVLLTSHLPLSEVSSAITPTVVTRGIDHAFEIRKYLGDKKKILFLGLNPHAGENGKIGKEEQSIKKVIEKHPYGKYIEGPDPADTAFIKVFAKEYRIVIACYHDQGLIPLKSTGDNIRHSVDVTWGLPFVRVTVDHGTAFNIVGKNIAQPYSFMKAWEVALSLLQRRHTRN